jgi:hypothetical protein
MTWWRGLVGILAAAVVVAPVAAEQPGLSLTTLAEGSQRALPVGPLVWQAFEYRFEPGGPALVTGEDAGFTWVVDGVARLQVDGQPATVAPAGTAVATTSGVRRSLGGVAPDGAVVWVIGLGGPTPGAFPMPPRLVFRSEPVVPPGGGPVVFQLRQIDLAGPGELAPAATPGTLTLFVHEGAVAVRTPSGGAVLRQGTVTTVPAEASVALTPLGGRSARLIALGLLASASTSPVAAPSLDLPDLQPNPAPIPFPLLPSGAFPRASR